MVCRLEIFRTELTPDKNAKIENIDAFLDNNEYASRTYNNENFQYQKITLDKEIKITADQYLFNGFSLGNYIRITQDDSKYYYFILSSEWLSLSACKLYCSIDSVNTFVDELEWSDKTHIIREHRDRYKIALGTATSLQYHFMARPVPGGTERVFTFIDEDLVGAEIKDFTYNVVSLEGQGYVEDVQIVLHDAKKGRVDFKTNIKVIGGARDTYSGTIAFSVNYVNAIKRLIDPTPEGLNPQLYGEDKGEILNDNDKSNWYVIYNTNVTSTTPEGANDPVDTLLCKDETITAMVNTGYANTVIITPQDIETGHYYFLDPFNGVSEKYKDKFASFHYWKGTKSSQKVYDNLNQLVTTTAAKDPVRGDENTAMKVQGMVFYKSGAGIQCDEVLFNGYTDVLEAPNGETVVTPLRLTEKITIKSDQTFKIFDSTVKPVTEKESSLYDLYKSSPVKPIEGGTKEPARIGGFNEVDVTVGTLIKIIKLPYCPIDYTVDNQGRYVFNYNLVRNSKENNKLNTDLLQIPNTIKFKSTIKSDLENPLFKTVESLKLYPKVTEKKNPKYETKLYHSEFYQPKFVYDSFGFAFDLEKVNTETLIPAKTEIEFVPTRVFNSNMMYRFNDYQTVNKDTEDFNNILIVNRNNEMPIFSSDYLNYIRNGYNYDKKVKDRNFVWGAVNAGIGLASTAASIAVPAVGIAKAAKAAGGAAMQANLWAGTGFNGNNPSTAVPGTGYQGPSVFSSLLLSGGVSGAASSVMNVANVFKQKKDAEMAIEQKKNVLANQAASVGNADSVDLLQEYCNNKAKAKLYTPNDKTKESIFDLFYYNGYNRNVRQLPNTNTRYWFNYIQCDPVFVGRNAIVYNNFIEDIKARYNEGVTVYHNRNGKYDLRQQYENWETILINKEIINE